MKVVALSGGVGGARLVDGLAVVLPPEDLTVVVNTGDDFSHWGLRICPDLDTVLYTLAGLADRQRGWGLTDESFRTLAGVEALGGEVWFQLGDRDLATHLVRSERLAAGEALSAVTAGLCEALRVGPRLLPMADEPCSTWIHCDRGRLSFQDWLVRARGEPTVHAVSFEGSSVPAAGVLDAIRAADLVVLPPSNPYVSLDPILALDGVREAVAGRPVVWVSPLVHGRAVKGPLAAMVPALQGVPPGPAPLLQRYEDLVGAAVVETGDGGDLELPVLETSTVMGDRNDRARLAAEVLGFATERLELRAGFLL